MIYICIVAGLLATIVHANTKELRILENGANKTVYLQSQGGFTTPNETAFTIPHGRQLFLTNTSSWGPSNFYNPNMLGGSIEFDISLGDAGCSCNMAVYLARMPYFDELGQPAN